MCTFITGPEVFSSIIQSWGSRSHPLSWGTLREDLRRQFSSFVLSPHTFKKSIKLEADCFWSLWVLMIWLVANKWPTRHITILPNFLRSSTLTMALQAGGFVQTGSPSVYDTVLYCIHECCKFLLQVGGWLHEFVFNSWIIQTLSSHMITIMNLPLKTETI